MQSLQRLGMAATVLGWWLEQEALGHVRVTVLEVGGESGLSNILWRMVSETTGKGAFSGTPVVKLPVEDSQRRRHIVAAQLAGDAPLYVSADDDCLPYRDVVPWSVPDEPEALWDHVRRVFAERPHLKMASFYPQPSTLRDPLTAPGVESDPDCWYVANTGGVRVMRGGVVTPDLPPLNHKPGPGYDAVLGEWLAGGPGMHREHPCCAYFRRALCNHLGYKFSTVWPGSHALERG